MKQIQPSSQSNQPDEDEEIKFTSFDSSGDIADCEAIHTTISSAATQKLESSSKEMLLSVLAMPKKSISWVGEFSFRKGNGCY